MIRVFNVKRKMILFIKEIKILSLFKDKYQVKKANEILNWLTLLPKLNKLNQFLKKSNILSKKNLRNHNSFKKWSSFLQNHRKKTKINWVKESILSKVILQRSYVQNQKKTSFHFLKNLNHIIINSIASNLPFLNHLYSKIIQEINKTTKIINLLKKALDPLFYNNKPLIKYLLKNNLKLLR